MSTKTVSEKQLQANRRNAAKSTGPKTPEGKARSRRNALKHGLLADQVLITDGDGAEDPHDFHALLDQFYADHQPASALEKMLVERIAALQCRARARQVSGDQQANAPAVSAAARSRPDVGITNRRIAVDLEDDIAAQRAVRAVEGHPSGIDLQ